MIKCNFIIILKMQMTILSSLSENSLLAARQRPEVPGPPVGASGPVPSYPAQTPDPIQR